ncbi:MAG: hypothetical protein Q8S26_02315 [Azonexus sp.]|nr:hypothetical protein [Azonexus sp.]
MADLKINPEWLLLADVGPSLQLNIAPGQASVTLTDEAAMNQLSNFHTPRMS